MLIGFLAVGIALDHGAAIDALRRLLRPSPLTMVEYYEAGTQGRAFDQTRYDDLLRRYVDADGWVDYSALKKDSEGLNFYIERVAEAPFADMNRDEKLALLINAYNAFTLRLILDNYPLDSILDIPAQERWEDRRWVVGGNLWSLDDIEHRQIRARFREPRIHFALVCAAIGCPKLRNEAYTADKLDGQLRDQALYVHAHDRWLDIDGDTVYLTPLYDWYEEDFVHTAGSILDFAARYSPAVAAFRESGNSPRVRFLDYDWTLNTAEKRLTTK